MSQFNQEFGSFLIYKESSELIHQSGRRTMIKIDEL